MRQMPLRVGFLVSFLSPDFFCVGFKIKSGRVDPFAENHQTPLTRVGPDWPNIDGPAHRHSVKPPAPVEASKSANTEIQSGTRDQSLNRITIGIYHDHTHRTATTNGNDMGDILLMRHRMDARKRTSDHGKDQTYANKIIH
jgi:hypothetical protein